MYCVLWLLKYWNFLSNGFVELYFAMFMSPRFASAVCFEVKRMPFCLPEGFWTRLEWGSLMGRTNWGCLELGVVEKCACEHVIGAWSLECSWWDEVINGKVTRDVMLLLAKDGWIFRRLSSTSLFTLRVAACVRNGEHSVPFSVVLLVLRYSCAVRLCTMLTVKKLT